MPRTMTRALPPPIMTLSPVSKKARELAEKSIAADAANVQARQNLAKTDSRLGVIALSLGKKDDAVAYLEKSALAFSELEKFDPNHRTYKQDIGRVLIFLGQTRHQQHAFDAALAIYVRAIATFQDIARADAGNNLAVRKLATVYQYIGDVHRDVAGTVHGETRQAHMQAAKENNTRALDILVRLQAKKAHTEYDLKYLGDLRAALSQIERE
jgi:tetratricopeptide (TPR) repeat protein